jgi:hypothetical protein
MKIQLEKEQLTFLVNYLKMKIKANEWVLENKKPADSSKLIEINDKLIELVDVLELEDTGGL